MNIDTFTKPSNSFSNNVMKLMTGTVSAQAIGILVMPIVTRLFAPEAFGIAAIFSALTGIVICIACLRYEFAIMLPKSNEEAANILSVSILSVIITTFLIFLLAWLGHRHILDLINEPQLENYLWLVPVTFFFQGIYLALNYWNTRTKHFGRISVAQISAALTTQTTKLAAGFSGFVSGGILIMTSVLGNIIATVILGIKIWRDDKKLFIEHVRWPLIGKGYKRFRKFPLIDTWGALMNSTSWQLPALMLSAFFTSSIVGYYALAVALTLGPLGIISNALSQVFYQKACDEKNEADNNGKLVEKLMETLIFIGLLPTMVLAIIGTDLFAVILGHGWAEAGLYAQILSPWIFFWFISSPLSVLFSVYERQGSALLVHSLILFSRVISLYIGGSYQNIYLALALFSVTGLIAYSFVSAWNIKLSKASWKKIVCIFLKYFFYSLPVCIIILFFKIILQTNPILILMTSILAIIVYYVALGSNFSVYNNAK